MSMVTTNEIVVTAQGAKATIITAAFLQQTPNTLQM